MGFFNKVKTLKSNKIEPAVSQNNENEEIIYKVEHVESLENNNEDLKEKIQVQNWGSVVNDEKIDKRIPNEIRNFKYLDRLIHSGAKEIVLDFDIVLENDEKTEYVDGINIDIDDITIDGKEHIIDACKKTRIFHVTGKNISINNITLKNGFSKKSGGAIDNESENLLINNAFFTDNRSTDGGAIHNTGKIKIIKSHLKYNYSFQTRGLEDEIEELKDSEWWEVVLFIIANVCSLGMGLICMISIKNNGNGGAIANYENLIIENSIIANNHAKDKGSAIYCGDNSNVSINEINLNNNESHSTIYCGDNSNVSINETNLNNNESHSTIYCGDNSNVSINETNLNNNESHSTIYGKQSNILLKNSSIKNETINDNQQVIHNELGHINIIECDISKNIGQKNIIYNMGHLDISNTNFFENNSKYIIDNARTLEIQSTSFINNKSMYIIFNQNKTASFDCRFIENNIEESVIYNNGEFCIVSKPIFENNISNNINSKNIFNKTNLTLISPKIEDNCKTIFNEGELVIKKSFQDFDSIIDGEYIKSEDLIPTKQKFDFGYLDKKIHESTSNKVILDEDICFEKYERDFYEGGIDLDIDNLIIDGNGHTIDGDNQSRIFIVTGKNIILKNITFKNGRTHPNFGYYNRLNSDGGAIQSNSRSNLKIIDCTFLDNNANNHGGAINNVGELSVFNNAFHDNTSKSGGAIYNGAKLGIYDSKFKNNNSTIGGAINNGDKRVMFNLKSKLFGGAINDDAKLGIYDSKFKNNNSTIGGAINNVGELSVFNNAFHDNTSNYGGAIFNNAKLLIFDSNFRKNSASYGGAIYTEHMGFIIKNSILQKNNVGIPEFREHNGIIGKHYKINCKFEKNWDEKFTKIFLACFILSTMLAVFLNIDSSLMDAWWVFVDILIFGLVIIASYFVVRRVYIS